MALTDWIDLKKIRSNFCKKDTSTETETERMENVIPRKWNLKTNRGNSTHIWQSTLQAKISQKG
jgi:hypothetical protein